MATITSSINPNAPDNGTGFGATELVTNTKLDDLGAPVIALTAGTIEDADVSATADIAGSKLADGGVTPAKLSAGGPSWNTNGTFQIGNPSWSKMSITDYGSGYGYGLEFFGKSGNVSFVPMVFRNGDGTAVGSITHTDSATAFNTSSDYRLKEDIVDIANSLERLKALKPCNFAWKVDGTRVDGFIAHEAQEVVPEAVVGTKDAVDEEGNPEYQGIDQSKLIPLLTKALQEAVARIEALEAK